MIRVVAAVIVRDGKIFVCQRRKDDSFPLKWEFPGGKVESGEEETHALVRELREELGVKAKIIRELERVEHHYANNEHTARGHQRKSFAIAFYLADIGAQVPQNFAFEKFKWELPGDLRSNDFLEANGALVRKIAEGKITLE